MTEQKIIPVTTGIGYGKTPLSSFDAALFQAGVGDLNLIHLSSVIPCNHTPKIQTNNLNGYRQGDRLYCVYAHRTTDQPGEQLAAGLGWVETTNPDPRSRWGLFVEHAGTSPQEVEEQIRNSLESMMQYRNEEDWGEIRHHITKAVCESDPVTAIVMAHYKLEAW